MYWRNFKLDPPYDSKEDEEAGYETDRTSAWYHVQLIVVSVVHHDI